MKPFLLPMRGTLQVLALAAALALAGGVQAGTKVKVEGDVDQVTEQVEGAFEALSVEADTAERNESGTVMRGKTRSGARLTVAVKPAGDDECELTVSSESPEDPEIEERFLRLMSSR